MFVSLRGWSAPNNKHFMVGWKTLEQTYTFLCFHILVWVHLFYWEADKEDVLKHNHVIFDFWDTKYKSSTEDDSLFEDMKVAVVCRSLPGLKDINKESIHKTKFVNILIFEEIM